MNLKQFKPLYWIYNLFHYRQLKHNEQAYKKYHLNKPLIASISSKDFPDKESKAWLDVGDSALLAPQSKSFKQFPGKVQEKIINWSRDGYMILENFYDEKTCDDVNNEIDRLLSQHKIEFTNGNKLMFANNVSSVIKKVSNDEQLRQILSFLLDREIVAFQTINFLEGSQQRAHSDSIHMTTYPLGFLIAAWIALEDVNHNNGPLFYYPGSHKLPFLLNSDYNQGETALTLGKKKYSDYEDVLDDVIKNSTYSRKEFHAKKGDVLIWHANLVHGGAPILEKGLTRKSMVVHYYAKDVIKYHEITERPTLLKEE